MKSGPSISTATFVFRAAPKWTFLACAVALIGAFAHGFFLHSATALVRSTPVSDRISLLDASALIIGLFLASVTALLSRLAISHLWTNVRIATRSELLQTATASGLVSSDDVKAGHLDSKASRSLARDVLSTSHSAAVSSRYFVQYVSAVCSVTGLVGAVFISTSWRVAVPFAFAFSPTFLFAANFVRRQRHAEDHYRTSNRTSYTTLVIPTVQTNNYGNKRPLAIDSDRALGQRYNNPVLARSITTGVCGATGVTYSLFASTLFGATSAESLSLTIGAILIASQAGKVVETFSILGRTVSRIDAYNRLRESLTSGTYDPELPANNESEDLNDLFE